jgi:hypothetical protein
MRHRHIWLRIETSNYNRAYWVPASYKFPDVPLLADRLLDSPEDYAPRQCGATIPII